ncbi:putative fatty acyl-CoA reductase CG5065 [Aricia agestis]|uniref:putative fatty acyl-CoA reductase CG5065 n=1 Tax=Aricia agestis TaxID=91739 RepID=UPI001C2065F8|nr:putative fatty acyl-CoA reductase CG5065 [Aricia agestis]
MVGRPKSPCEALIPQFYAGRSVFITGATGLMGKVLIERLLSTCPDIGKLYLLVRPKKEVLPEKRLQGLKDSMAFANLRQQRPAQLEKLCIIPGDVSLPGYGLSPESLQQLKEVSIIFHSAATVKFDEPLPAAVEMNIKSVIRLMDICDTLPKLETLVHVSTAYSNPERYVVEERVYEPPTSVDKLLSVVECLPQHILDTVTSKFISPKPNTYTYTKAMAEVVVNTRPKRHYSVAIFRPTIVISAKQHPFPGWIDNLNGPSGVIVASGKGLLHVFLRSPDVVADLLPVDIAIDTMIAVAWETTVDKLPEARVYNCSTYENPTCWDQMERNLRRNFPITPLDDALWYPSAFCVSNTYSYMLLVFLLQTLPLTLAEYVTRIFGMKMKFNLVMVEQKIRNMTEVLSFFSMREWQFRTDNVCKLRDRLTLSDKAIYNLDPKSINWDEQYASFVLGVRKYILKEKDEKLPESRRHLNRLYYLHKCVTVFFIAVAVRLIMQNHWIRTIASDVARVTFFVIFSFISQFVELS